MEKQSKTESNNTKWKILIDGDKKYIDDLIEGFKTLKFEPKIYEEEGNFYLEGKIFDDTDNAQRIASIANTFLTIAPAIPHFKSERAIEQLKVLKISYKDEKEERVYDSEGNPESSVEISEDGKRSIRMYVGSGTFKITGNAVYLATSKDRQILGGLTTIESIIRHLLKAKNDSESLKNVAEYLKPFLENLTNFSFKFPDETPTKDIVEAEFKYGKDFELAKWTALRKIYEAIREDLGLDFIKNYLGAQLADDFYYTTCYYYIHTETGNIKEEYEKPSRKMPLSEAEELISKLLSKYIEEKVKGGEP